MDRELGRLIAIATCCLCLAFAAVDACAKGPVRVRGYVNKNGTYVAPHYRSAPNKSRFDNYSSRGNYNPYTGEPGTQTPYGVPRSGYNASTVVPAYQLPALIDSPPTPSAVQQTNYDQPRYETNTNPSTGTSTYEIYRCEAANGAIHYVSYPRAGCDFVTDYTVQSTAPAAYPGPRSIEPMRQFRGWRSTSGGSGHQAGREWAEQKGIQDPDDCGGNSRSFIEGCEEYAEELQEAQDFDE